MRLDIRPLRGQRAAQSSRRAPGVDRRHGWRDCRRRLQANASAATLLTLALLAVMLGGCSLPFPTSGGASTHPTATAIPSLAAHKGGADALELAAPAPSATQCAQIPTFASAQVASAGSTFADVPFPPQSVAVAAPVAANVYAFALVSACTQGAGAQSILAFYGTHMVAAGWSQSATYPYGGDGAHACGDAYCWRKADKAVRYVSLEQVRSNDALTVYTLRLATAPAPTAALAVRSGTGSARPGGTATASASCQAGEQMVGGGFNISSSDHGYTVRTSFPSAAGTWTASATASDASPLTLQVFAGCVQSNYSLGIQIVSAAFDTHAGAPQQSPVLCASGVVTGGGAQIATDHAVLAESAPSDDSKSWMVVAAAGASGAQGMAYALCATHNIDAVPSTKRSFTIESGNDAQASLACLSDQWLTSGGYSNADPSADGKNLFSLDGPTADYSRWFLQGHNFDPSSAHGATIWAMCVHPDPQF